MNGRGISDEDSVRPTIQSNLLPGLEELKCAAGLITHSCLSTPLVRERNGAELSVRRRHPVSRVNHLTSHRHELLKARARDDDRVATTMCFLGDTHEAASFVFSKFNVEVLTLNLEFFRDNYVIHDDLEGMPLKQSIPFRPRLQGEHC
jgi:hypothetical protein